MYKTAIGSVNRWMIEAAQIGAPSDKEVTMYHYDAIEVPVTYSDDDVWNIAVILFPSIDGWQIDRVWIAKQDCPF